MKGKQYIIFILLIYISIYFLNSEANLIEPCGDLDITCWINEAGNQIKNAANQLAAQVKAAADEAMNAVIGPI